MIDEFANQVERLKKEERKLKNEITKRSELETTNQPTSLVYYINPS
jgi:hypothetical protein